MCILCLYIQFVNRLHEFRYLRLIFNFNVDFMLCGLFILLLWLIDKFYICICVHCSVRNVKCCCVTGQMIDTADRAEMTSSYDSSSAIAGIGLAYQEQGCRYEVC